MQRILFCAVLLAAAVSFMSFAEETLHAQGLPLVRTLGCRLNGLNVVCDRGMKLLPNREKKLKLRKKKSTAAPKAAPAHTKSKSPSTSARSQSTKSKASTGRSPKSSAAPTTEEPAEPAPEPQSEAVESSDQHSCPPGDVVLEKPNASGSYCEPVAVAKPAGEGEGPNKSESEAKPKTGQAAPAKPAANAAPAASPADAAIPADIRAAACGPGAEPDACVCPTGSDHNSAACKAAIPSCCGAEVSAGGKPQPAISRCGVDQNAAMSSVVAAAMEKKLTLGSVRCTNQ